jgi:hypothetical protein
MNNYTTKDMGKAFTYHRAADWRDILDTALYMACGFAWGVALTLDVMRIVGGL